ncbi:hypothetical protein BDW71DRAFT_185419 [Aspergillus fruticulosus]
MPKTIQTVLEMRRFERIHDVVEPVEEYRPGGYHPVHLNDVYHKRYKVVGKLAIGQFSTVWFAQDQTLQKHVALKIVKADASKESKELDILLYLSQKDHPGKCHVVEILDHFYHDGPNGSHLSLVLPFMLLDGHGMTVTGKPHNAAYVRSISKQIILGLDFLHSQGMVHSDLQPANILVYRVSSAQDEISLGPPEFSPVRWLDGIPVDNSTPKYLMPTQRRRGQLDGVDASKLLVKIGDLGSVILNEESNRIALPVTPTALRAPELIYGRPWNKGIDIWALGCLLFELATNEPLFPLGTFGLSTEEVDQEHLRLIRHLLDGEGLVNRLTNKLPLDFGAENIQSLGLFLDMILQQDSGKRMGTAELLKQPFVVGNIEG